MRAHTGLKLSPFKCTQCIERVPWPIYDLEINFSVTATFVGATYTGAGCSVPSLVLSTMLPFLPIIGDLQSSYNISLEKQTGHVLLTVYFQVKLLMFIILRLIFF